MRATIVSRIYPPEPAAAALFLGAVTAALQEAGHEVRVLTARPPRSLAHDRPPAHVRTFPVLRDRNGYVRGYLPYLSFDVPVLFRLLFSRRADVVLVEPPPTTGAVVRLVCAVRRIPYVYDAADIWSDAAGMATSSSTVVRVLRMIERFALRGAARLVTISADVARRLAELNIRRPVRITGFGADTQTFAYRHADRAPYFVYAGSYSTWHGAEVALDALALLRTDHADYRLVVIGNGDPAALRARADELGVADSVTVLPPMAAEALVAHLAAATASIATLRPGTGYDYAFTSKAYSSLAVGCPVVFAGPGPTGPFLEAVNRHVRAGRAVPFDAVRLAEALRHEIEDPASPRQRRELAAWTAREHSMQAVAHRVREVLEDAAGATR